MQLNIHPRYIICFLLFFTVYASRAQYIFTLAELEGIVPQDTAKLTAFAKSKGYKQFASGEEVFIEGMSQPKFVNAYIDSKKYYLEYDALTKSIMYIISQPSAAMIQRFDAEIKKNYTPIEAPGWYQHKTKPRIGVSKMIGDYVNFKNALIVNITYVDIQMPGYDQGDESTDAEVAVTTGPGKLKVNSFTKTTNITIKKGDKLRLKASGNITFGTFAGSGGPAGINGYTSYNRIAGFRHGALLAKIGDGEYFAVGDSHFITAPNSGTLHLLVNDGDPSNNSGSFTVEYSIIK